MHIPAKLRVYIPPVKYYVLQITDMEAADGYLAILLDIQRIVTLA